jgi:hypothetical protein
VNIDLVTCLRNWLEETNNPNWLIIREGGPWLEHIPLKPYKNVVIPHYHIGERSLKTCCSPYDQATFKASDPEFFAKLLSNMANSSSEYVYTHANYPEGEKNAISK